MALVRTAGSAATLVPSYVATPWRVSRKPEPPRSQLIQPGQPRSSQPGQLIIPGMARNQPAGGPLLTPGMESGAAGGVQQAPAQPYAPFKPPTEVLPEELPKGTPDELLERLMERMGVWHELEPYIRALHRLGFSSGMIDEAVGMTAVEQNMNIVGAKVYSSLKDGGLDPADLAFFDNGGAEILYELRLLSETSRVSAANYLIQSNGDASKARELTRAIKEWERRRLSEGRSAFSERPGDCLAFNHYRFARESRSEGERAGHVRRGLEVAETEEARRMLEELLQKEEEKVAKVSRARLEVVRLRHDETTPLAVPLLGTLGDVTSDALTSAPVANTGSAFPIFTVSAPGQWVALPTWLVVSSARSLVAFMIEDARELPNLSQAREELGPCILVADRGAQAVVGESYFIVGKDDGQLGIESGAEAGAKGRRVYARVLMALRPPVPGTEDEERVADWE